MINQQSNGIHCKVSSNGELRRFLFTGTEFTSLYQQVQSVMGLGNKEFVLKYKDDEGDMITLTTTEELNFAISCLLPNSTLRLDLSEKTVSSPSPSIKQGDCRRRKWEDCGEGSERKWEKRKGHCLEKRQEKLEAKKQWISQCIQKISDVPENQGNPEWRQRRLQHLQQKLIWIDSVLSGNPNEDFRPSYHKMHHHPHDNFHKKQKCEKKPMTPEKKALIDEAKEKIRSQKEVVCQLNSELRNRKSEWTDLPVDKKDESARAIMELKQQKKEAKKALWEMKKNICEIYRS